MLIFIYGTLKSGEPNHDFISTQEPGQYVFKGRGVTMEKYPLVVALSYNIPFLLYKPGIGHEHDDTVTLGWQDSRYVQWTIPDLLYKPEGTNYECIKGYLQFQNVEGEIYEVGDDCLSVLDMIEHHPDFYTRQQLQVRIYPESQKEEQGQIIECYAYFLVNFRESLLENPMYKCYTDNIDGKKFVAPAERRATSLPMHEVHKGYDPDS